MQRILFLGNVFAWIDWRNYDFWDLVINVLSVVATTAIALLAIWPQIKASRSPAKLRIALRSARTKRESFDGGTRCVHVEVHNDNRNISTARNVVLYVSQLTVFESNEEPIVFDTGLVPVKWQFNDCMWPSDEWNKPRPVDIGPSRVGDVLFLHQDHLWKDAQVCGREIRLRNHFEVSDFRDAFRGPTHIQLELKAIGDNAESAAVGIDIRWDGEWSDNDDEMEQHLTIRLV